MEAMKHQGRTSAQVGQKLTSVQQIADNTTDSCTQIQRYIRLTNLEKTLLDMEINFAWFPYTEDGDEIAAYTQFVLKLYMLFIAAKVI